MDVYKIKLEQIKYQGTMQLLNASRFQKTAPRISVKEKQNHSYAAGFSSVTLLEEDVKAYYGAVKITGSNTGKRTSGCKSEKQYQQIDNSLVDAIELPELYHTLKDSNVYYHGELISEYELTQIAVASGKMELTDDMPAFMAAKTAFQVMIEEPAAAKYAWSSTKYSEDGYYTFTKNEDGTYSRHLVEDEMMGASIDEIADWICSGTPNRNIDRRYLIYLQRLDPDLYHAAQNIGNEVRTFNLMSVAYDAGVLSDAQHDYDLSLLGILFGEHDIETMYQKLMKCKETGGYRSLLEAYQPQGAAYLLDLRQQQLEKTGGIM